MQTDTKPPMDLEAERALIGLALSDENVLRNCPVLPEDFHLVAHRDLWAGLRELYQDDTPTTMTRVVQYLATKVPSPVIADCIEHAGLESQATDYMRRIHGAAVLRAAIVDKHPG